MTAFRFTLCALILALATALFWGVISTKQELKEYRKLIWGVEWRSEADRAWGRTLDKKGYERSESREGRCG